MSFINSNITKITMSNLETILNFINNVFGLHNVLHNVKCIN